MIERDTGFKERGFTLIELMIVLAIVGILATVAYPSYINSMMKSSRAAAQAHLMDVAQAQQRYFNDSRSYANIATLDKTVPDRVSTYYTVAYTVPSGATPPTFTITATPIAGTRQVGDGILSIDNTGSKSRGVGVAW